MLQPPLALCSFANIVQLIYKRIDIKPFIRNPPQHQQSFTAQGTWICLTANDDKTHECGANGSNVFLGALLGYRPGERRDATPPPASRHKGRPHVIFTAAGVGNLLSPGDLVGVGGKCP